MFLLGIEWGSKEGRGLEEMGILGTKILRIEFRLYECL